MKTTAQIQCAAVESRFAVEHVAAAVAAAEQVAERVRIRSERRLRAAKEVSS